MAKNMKSTRNLEPAEVTTGTDVVATGGSVHLPDLPAQRQRESMTDAETFLKFNYPELKDLGKHFLTISSASAVFLVTFVDKFMNADAQLSTMVKICMICLVMSITSAGTGLFTNYVAGSGASGAIIWGAGKNFRLLTMCTYILYMVAGASLACAFGLLGYETLHR